MLLRTVGVCVSLVLLVSSASAEPVLSIDGPAHYTPGEAFQCQVVLTGATHLASYTMDLVLSAAGGTPGTDFYFQAAAQPPSRYVFAGQPTVGFTHSATGGAGITVGDSLSNLLAEVDTVAGVNDLVAVLTVKTSASLTGNLVLSFDTDYLYVDDSAAQPIPGFQGMVASIEPMTVPIIPEPGSLALSCVAAAVVAAKRRRRVGV